MKWFENWFDSKYYHILYQHRDWNEAKEFISKLVNYLPLAKNAKILDLACGKGRHSKQLNEFGFSVLGIDLSENSINIAKEMENETLHFQVGDMRKVHFENEFDAIFNLFTSFGYFDSYEENHSVFDAVSAQLKQNGYFIFDYLNPTFVKNQLIEKDEKFLNGIHFKIQKKIQKGTDLTGEKVIKTINFEDNNQLFQFKEQVQLFELDDLIHNFEVRNFEILTILGDYQLIPFDQNTSPRIIVIAKKK